MTLTKIFKSVSFKEWRFVALLSVVVIFLTTITLIYGWLISPEGQTFSGIHFTAPNDWFVYYSYIEQGVQGKILYKNLFTAEPHLPTLNIFWTFMGLVTKFSGLPLVVSFNLVRILLIPVFYFVAYLFLAYIFSDVSRRKASVLLLSFASGLGILLINRIIKYPFNYDAGVFQWPMDLWVPESITFTTLDYSPHMVASLILLLMVLFLSALYVENRKFSYSLWTGICACLLFAFHPFHVLSLFSILLLYFVVLMVRERKVLWYLVGHYFIFGLISSPAILYYFYLLGVDPVQSQKAAQNLTFITPLWITLFSYGLLLFFAIFGTYFWIKSKKISNQVIFIISWVVAQSLVLYSPVNFQRRMTEGLHFPLVVLTTVGLFSLFYLIKQQNTKLKSFLYKQRYTVLMVLIFFFTTSNFFQLAADSYIYYSRREVSYIDKDLIEAARWFKSVEEHKIIFNSSRTFVNIVPAYSGRSVYTGHGVLTPFFRQKEFEVGWFFKQNRDEKTEHNFLRKRNINYIFYTQAEKDLGNYDPAVKPYLKEVFSNSQATIYEVIWRI